MHDLFRGQHLPRRGCRRDGVRAALANVDIGAAAVAPTIKPRAVGENFAGRHAAGLNVLTNQAAPMAREAFVHEAELILDEGSIRHRPEP